MNFNTFLHPDIIQDTPRLFTAIAEWLAVFVYLNIYKKRLSDMQFVVGCTASFFALAIFQFIAGLLSIWFWIPGMIVAVALMYFSLFIILDIKPMDCGVLTVHAFVLAEFAASLYRQLYVWLVYLTGLNQFVTSFCLMLIVYMLSFGIYFKIEKDHISGERNLNISKKELISIIATGLGAFIMGNISFVWTTTPFSATDNMLYVRTLVDFGGMLMLMTQMERRNELFMKNESASINQLFQKQYEQYKLAIDNSELLRKEMHDMKHYVAALKAEDDAKKRAEILEDMEQNIAIQESFMNTGNKVLDVILTTKSLQCEKQNITLNAMVDGDVLKDIHVKDICSLFGNVLDNAIEATQMVEDKEKRLITLSVHQRNQFIVIECENYSDTAPVFEENRTLKTTKADKVHHGYGLKSIKQVAEKYGGAMNATSKDGWFKVKILLSTAD